ncbi:MAG TPA: xanthine dehydrogenase family protein molybdopterin-binding subunit, partial [Acidimicrobiales bacterium]|nr:xanthine dehydrogenase family protein molybdopterin-binding subunit [Acidimicrobiales bacterium]
MADPGVEAHSGTRPDGSEHHSVLGHAIDRREDPDLLLGAAGFVGDLTVPGLVHACFVRSQVAHAILTRVDLDDARKQPGVVAALGAEDLDLSPLPEGLPPPEGARPDLARPCLASERVRFVGEAVAVIVAEDPAAAVDAAEAVEVDLEDLAPVVDPLAALATGAPLVFPAHGTNVVLEFGHDARDGDDALAGAEVVVSGRVLNQRVAPVPMEPNGALAVPEADGRLSVWASTQAPFRVRDTVAFALGCEPGEVRVLAPAVGGGFGAKGGVYPEVVVVAALAKALGRPVRWVETRSENLVAMTHGRGQVQDFELGARSDGTIVGLRARSVVEAGAYPWRGGLAARTSHLMAQGPYRIPRVDHTATVVVTNTTPLGPYRGAGRPEAADLLERAMDRLAWRLGLDPAEVRRRNLLTAAELPLRTPTGASYDSGDYPGALQRAMDLADYQGLRREQAERRGRGDRRSLGIGLASFVEISGAGWEYGAVGVDPDGGITVRSGSSPHGQGHETTLAQVAASVLGVPLAGVRVVHSDTDAVPRGIGTFGSRSGQLAGSAVHQAAEVVLARARQLAAEVFEASPADLVRDDQGRFCVAGVPTRALSWEDLAGAATAEGQAELFADGDFTQEGGTYPSGTHLAVVEVDTETGFVELRRLVAVDDCGVILNPTIVTGQVHGGLAQGVAQALFEAQVYDDAGNPLATTLVD